RFSLYTLISLHAAFFLQCYGDHLDLHSFPTRRSSDLVSRSSWRASTTHSCSCAVRSTSSTTTSSSTTSRTCSPCRPRRSSSSRRSEEHTSELQSRENLVCRLLLEKKKKKYTNTRQPKT